MAFSPPSHQRSYTLCSSLDPALDLPDIPALADGAQPSDVEARDKVIEERNLRLRVARETGRWHEITKSGEKPTAFTFRQIYGTDLTWLQGEAERRNLSHDEVFELAFRLALESVDNFGKLRLNYEHVDGHRLVTRESIEPLFGIGRDVGEPLLGRTIVLELGMLVFTRAIQGVPPLS